MLSGNLVVRCCLLNNVRYFRAAFCSRHFSDNKNSNNNNVDVEDQDVDVPEESLVSTSETFKTFLERKNLKELLDDIAPSKELEETSTSGEWATPMVPKNLLRELEITKQDAKPIVDPRETSVLLFPGQGSQYVGMGRDVIDVPNVPEMFKTAKKILGYDLLDLCLNGPVDHLNKTQYCQPAIFVNSLAAVERLRVAKPGEVESCCAVAGFSVGELAALVFAGALTFEDGLRLVKIRAEAMQFAAELVPSGMMTVFLTPATKINFACHAAREWCVRRGVENEHAVCSVANYLFPHCKVLAGHQMALEFLEMNASDFGFKKVRRLPVSGAFHTKLMNPAREVFKRALQHIKIEDPLIPVYSNFDGKKYWNNEGVRSKLVAQITSPVKWEQILHAIYERPRDAGFPRTYECGPGTSLLSVLGMVNGMARRKATSVRV